MSLVLSAAFALLVIYLFTVFSGGEHEGLTNLAGEYGSAVSDVNGILNGGT
jgi:hypothetical protein